MQPLSSRVVSDWCEAKPGAVLEYPFGPEAAVFKVAGKMFALGAMEGPPDYITLKAVPEEGEALRAQHAFIREGYYMNKRHWNTVVLDGSVPEEEVLAMIDDSYELVVKGLPKAQRPK